VINSECTRERFVLLREEQVVMDLSNIGRDFECEYKIPVFADQADVANTYNNDFFAPLLTLTNATEDPKFFLEKQDDCEWNVLTELTDDTFGLYATFPSQPNWLGYKLEWHLVQAVHGNGCYRIRATYNDLISGDPFVQISYRFQLRNFNLDVADKTVKLTYTQRGGKIGDKFDDELRIDFKNIIWEREFRTPGFFGFETSEYVREFVRYQNGAENWSKDEQIESIICVLRNMPYELHRATKIDAFQSGELFMSDYNKGNQTKYDHKRVNPKGGYEPDWGQYNSYTSVGVAFNPHFNNLDRTRC